ncbi:MAG: PIN domain-containing protein [Anaerolineae bacterium]
MKYLLDTNILLELLLAQDRADEVKTFLQTIPPAELCLSEFSLYSLGIILFRRQHHREFLKMTKDLQDNGIQLTRITANELPNVASIAQQFSLDFDDAYQYAIAEKFNLTIVSFDHDFDRTKRSRKTPEEVLRELP